MREEGMGGLGDGCVARDGVRRLVRASGGGADQERRGGEERLVL